MSLTELKTETPTLLMLVGLPGSGKSTFIKELAEMYNSLLLPTTVVSTDNYIDLIAMERMKTYNDVFQDVIDEATRHAKQSVIDGVKNGHHIVWDQTNLTIKGRKSKLAMIPYTYFKKAVVVCCSSEERWNHRLVDRPGKVIPSHVLTNMMKGFEMPTTAEGFDVIEHIFT